MIHIFLDEDYSKGRLRDTLSDIENLSSKELVYAMDSKTPTYNNIDVVIMDRRKVTGREVQDRSISIAWGSDLLIHIGRYDIASYYDGKGRSITDYIMEDEGL